MIRSGERARARIIGGTDVRAAPPLDYFEHVLLALLGMEAGADLAADIGAGVTLDVHASDQLLVYLALAGGESRFATRVLSNHARTTMWLIEQFLPVHFETAIRGDAVSVAVRGA